MTSILALDFSTSATGWALFSAEDKKLKEYEVLKKSLKGAGHLEGMQKTLKMIDSMINKIVDLIHDIGPDYLVIEEITGAKGSTGRLSQKTLDGAHFLLYERLYEWMPRTDWYDVSGKRGWRTDLGIKLNDADRINNKEARKLNKSLGRGQKLPIVGPKNLSCRYANNKFGLELDCDARTTDGDKADAICVGYGFITHRIPKKWLKI